MWHLGLLAMAASGSLRIPVFVEYARGNIPAELRREVDDAELVDLAINVGVVFAVVVGFTFYALLLAGCNALDRRLVPVGLGLPRGQHVGYFWSTVVVAVTTTHLAAVILGHGAESPPPSTYVQVAVVVAALALAFRRPLAALGRARCALVVLVALLLSLLPIAR